MPKYGTDAARENDPKMTQETDLKCLKKLFSTNTLIAHTMLLLENDFIFKNDVIFNMSYVIS